MFLQKRGKEDNYYKLLQDKTLERLEQLCGKRWTDYNVHDPGITISDYLNYALFELHYRLQFSFEAYLAESEKRDISFAHKGLLPKEELFTISIVTEQDYEDVIKQEHPLIDKCVVKLNKATKLYDIYFSLKDKTVDEEGIKGFTEEIRKTYHKHRNLCESVGAIETGFYKLNDEAHYQKEKFFKKNTYEFPDFNPQGPDEPIVPFSADYKSIQFDFPENYGISERGLPVRTSDSDEAKILQLKAYLLIFDYLLADTLQQAENISDLLDFSGKIPENIIPDIIIPEIERIVDAEKKLSSQLHDEVHFNRQKSKYFDVLDVLYGEDTRAIFDNYSDNDYSHETNENRAKLIRSLPHLNANRFKSFNIYDKNSSASIQEMIEALTNYHYETIEVDTFSKYGLRIISDEEFFEKYKFLQNMSFRIDIEENAHLLDIDLIDVAYDDRTFHKLRMNINLLWYNVLFESFLKYGDNRNNYKILCLPDDEYLLVFNHPEKDEWINMGLFFSNVQKLTEMANLFWQFIRRIKDKEIHTGFYFVEHVLLSHTRVEDRQKLSVVVLDQFKSDYEREKMESLLSERLPAHLWIKLIYLGKEELHVFEQLYSAWRKAMAKQEVDDVNYLSASLRAFLDRHTEQSRNI